MTAKKLSTLSQDFIDAYGNTARNVIQAYRASGERVAGFVEQRWEQAMEQTRGQLVAEVHDNARHAHTPSLCLRQKVSAAYKQKRAGNCGEADLFFNSKSFVSQLIG